MAKEIDSQVIIGYSNQFTYLSGMKCTGVMLLLLLLSCSPPAGKEPDAVAHMDSSSKKSPQFYSPDNSPLVKDEKTIVLQYITWGYAHANWVEAAQYDRYIKENSLADHAIFIEPATKQLELPDTLGYNEDQVAFTGHFYTQKGYPAGQVMTEEKLDSAFVFRYTSYKVITSKHAGFTKIELGN